MSPRNARAPRSPSRGASRRRRQVVTEIAEQAVPVSSLSRLQWLGVGMLMLLAFGSALGVVYTTHESRVRTNALQELENERNRLQVEWGRLLLEQSSLVSQGRIESRAISELGMKVPDSDNVIIMRQDRN